MTSQIKTAAAAVFVAALGGAAWWVARPEPPPPPEPTCPERCALIPKVVHLGCMWGDPAERESESPAFQEALRAYEASRAAGCVCERPIGHGPFCDPAPAATRAP